LRAQIDAGVGQPAAGELEGRIQAQPVEVVGILVAAGDRENAGAQDIGQPMSDPALIAAVRDHRGEPFGEAQPPLRLGEQITPPSEESRPPSKAAVTFLRPMAGKQNGSKLSSVMAGVAASDLGAEWLRHPISTLYQSLMPH